MWKKFLGCGALSAVIVLAGVVLVVAYVLSGRLPTIPGDGKVPTTVALSGGAQTAATGTAFLLVDRSGAKLLAGEKVITLRWPDDRSRLGMPFSRVRGVDVVTGDDVGLEETFVPASLESNLRSPSGEWLAVRAQPKADGTGTVLFQTASTTQTVALRLAKSQGVRNITLLGWWSDDELAVVGSVTASRALFAVHPNGRVAQVALLPDAMTRVRLQAGSAWYVTVTPGEGLEADDQPPSALHRVGRDGKDVVVVEEKGRIITRYATSPEGDVAYQVSDGEGLLLSAKRGTTTNVGKESPVMVASDGSAIFLRGEDIVLRRPGATGEAVMYRGLVTDPKTITGLYVIPEAHLGTP